MRSRWWAQGWPSCTFGGNTPTVGASGAIYGLFGALIAIGLRLGKEGRGLISATLPILIVNLVLTFTIPMISIAGHIGGLACGFVTGLALQRRPAHCGAREARRGRGHA